MRALNIFVQELSVIERFPHEIGKDIREMVNESGILAGFIKNMREIVLRI